jgi:hypothetical protein
MPRMLLLAALLFIFPLDQVGAEIKSWRVGDSTHPWIIEPVSGRLTLGWGWAVEILVDEDGDGLIDEDPVELVDNDNDGLFNEDPEEEQVDNDNDGVLNEDPVDNLDNDGDGLVDEDPEEIFDNDLDGLFNEDGPDDQIDNDNDGALNEDGLMSNGDNDNDGLFNEDLADGIDNDGDGLIDEDLYGFMTLRDNDNDAELDEDPPDGIDNDGDGKIDEDGPAVSEAADGVTSWLHPIRLSPTRNLATLVNERYLNGEFGGLVPGRPIISPFMVVPSEVGFRQEKADPISSDNFGVGSARSDYGKMVDGNIFTAFGASGQERNRTPSFNFKGYFFINRVMFRPRPTVPNSTVANYFLQYGDQTTINPDRESIQASRIFWPQVEGQSNPVIKDLIPEEPVLVGRLDINARDPRSLFTETAEAHVFGVGYATDASFSSEIIDVGLPEPRYRRYTREVEQFSNSERSLFEQEFPERNGNVVNWGKVRWRGKRIGEGGDIRIQFRVGNSLDTHIYSRRLAAGLTDTRDEDGNDLDIFSWIKLVQGQVQERNLQYNEIGIDIGQDGKEGWSFWSAPFKFEDGLIDDTLPEDQWHEQGVALPLPGGTRYIQFRIIFDNELESAIMLDFLEFDYQVPLVSGGVVAEVFPPQVPIGEETSFRYIVRPLFERGETTTFNRIEIDVPGANSHIDTLRFDGRAWREIEVPAVEQGLDPLLGVEPAFVPETEGSDELVGQFAQAVVTDSVTGSTKLLLKFPPMEEPQFRFGENLELVFRSILFRGSTEFTSVLWNDLNSQRNTTIPQPIVGGDATPEIATNALLVVVEDINQPLKAPRVTPNPFTPNGDGINDEITLSFDLFLVLDTVGIEVEVFDLSGNRVHSLTPVSSSAGSVQIKWDGRDADGTLVPPGLYLYRLKIDSDNSSGERVGSIAVLY